MKSAQRRQALSRANGHTPIEDELSEYHAPQCYSRMSPHSQEMVASLSLGATSFRIAVLKLVHRRQSGHLGGAFSIAEILTALYFHHLQVDPNSAESEDRDRLLFSKGHACAMLYTVLAYRGFFPVEELWSFRNINSRLQGHPERQALPGLEIPSGPLGHGVAVGAGMALAAKLDRSKWRVYVILGDGEINAGVVWEGALVASKYQLDNMTVILDYNGVQQTGLTAQALPTEPVADKWRSFGWHVLEIHGHNMTQILSALDEADEIHARPVIIIARTTKGKGVSFMENNHYWHGSSPSDDQFQTALQELRERASKWDRS